MADTNGDVAGDYSYESTANGTAGDAGDQGGEGLEPGKEFSAT